MNKQQVIDFLIKAGIWVKDGKIAKADVEKVKGLVEAKITEFDSNTYGKLNKIYNLVLLIDFDGKKEILDIINNAKNAIYDKAHSKFKEQIPGGISSGKDPKEFNQKQLLMGINVEVEHTDDVLMAMEIGSS